MPTIQKIVNGNGQVTVEPSSFEVPVNTIVTVRAYPYEGEIVDTAEFEENINGVWHWVGVSEISHNVWRFRIENDMRINILFTSRYDPPPEPPEPPEPPTPFLTILPAILKRKQWWRY